MRENFLHYLWRYKKLPHSRLNTTSGQELQIIDFGTTNTNAGPDILHATIKIDDIVWSGHIEFHTRSSHWVLHDHHTDLAFNMVILHVVWDHDTEVFCENGKKPPTLELKGIVDESYVKQHNDFFVRPLNWINCEKQIDSVKPEVLNNWFKQLYFSRLKQKQQELLSWHKKLNQNWEALTFIWLAKYLGGPVNSDAFLSLATSFDFNLVLKLSADPLILEALFFGQASLLNPDLNEDYVQLMLKEYKFLQLKYHLNNENLVRFRFMRLRPSGFPTIRISQLAQLYVCRSTIFEEIIKCESPSTLFRFFRVKASSYWDHHYRFGKKATLREKWLSNDMVLKILINVVLPLKYFYMVYSGSIRLESISKFARDLNAENNKIVSGFEKIGINAADGLTSQAMIELKSNYCDKNECLQCQIGNKILSRNM